MAVPGLRNSKHIHIQQLLNKFSILNNNLSIHTSPYLNKQFISFQLIFFSSFSANSGTFVQKKQYVQTKFPINAFSLHILIHLLFNPITFIKYCHTFHKLSWKYNNQSHITSFEKSSTRYQFHETQQFCHKCGIFRNKKVPPILFHPF